MFECFSEQHPFQEGKGPRTIEFLYSKQDIYNDFPNYEIIELRIEVKF